MCLHYDYTTIVNLRFIIIQARPHCLRSAFFAGVADLSEVTGTEYSISVLRAQFQLVNKYKYNIK